MTALCLAVGCYAKDIKTVVFSTNPEMHCENCENKIKTNIRFEKGIKAIETSLEEKTVTIKYDADKTTVDNIIAGFSKIGYEAKVVKTVEKKPAKEAETDGTTGASERRR